MTNLTVSDADGHWAAFVRRLTTRTIEGLARWEGRPNGLISRLPGSMFVQFITHSSPSGQTWRLFTVRDSNGELFQATASADAMETALSLSLSRVLQLALMFNFGPTHARAVSCS